MNHDGVVGGGKILFLPNIFVQGTDVQYFPPVLEEKAEDLVLLVRQVDESAVFDSGFPVFVQANGVTAQGGLLSLIYPVAAEQGFYLQQQFVGGKGLDQIIIAAV